MSDFPSIITNSRKPLSRIFINTGKENLDLSNVEDYFTLAQCKKKKFIQKTQSNPISIYHLRPRSTKDVIGKLKKLPSVEQTDDLFSITSNIILNKSITNPNPQYVDDYLHEIIDYYHSIERTLQLSFGYMTFQKEINQKMRSILIDWLVDVHLKFNLVPETLYLAVNILDRFLAKYPIERSRLQLVGITSLFIACKYEEIYPPEIKDHVYITDKAYTKEDIIQMEQNILGLLEYNICYPSSLRFLEIYYQSTLYSNKTEDQDKEDEGKATICLFAQYLIELCLCEYNMLKYSPGEIALSSFYISSKIKLSVKEGRLEDFAKVFGYKEEKLRECAKDVCILLEQSENHWLQAVRKKFYMEKYESVANWRITRVNSHYMAI